MTPTGGYVDVSTLIPLLLTVVLLSLGFANFIKLTASKYLNPNLRFDSGGKEIQHQESEKEESTQMLQRQDNVCAVCGKPGSKRCSRCKSVRYCSLECQTKHWHEEGHKQDCQVVKASAEGAVKSALNFSNAFGTPKIAISKKASSPGVLLTPSNANSDNILQNTKRVLFPYETFVELFNWNKSRLPPCGLINCGNSCFANVVLQCLTYTRPLVAYLLEGIHSKTCARNDWCFLCELHQHVRRVIQSQEPFEPFGILCHIPKMGGNLGCGKQEDAHEFMGVAVDSMQSICLDEFGGEKALDHNSRETTITYYIFGGHLRNRITCTQCCRVSDSYENMMGLLLEIDGDVASLEDALKKHTSLEMLDGENKYQCDGCDAYVRAQKQLTVDQAPNILTIALKRFQSGRFGKLNKRVTFPETLDMSPYVSGEDKSLHMYKLYAVVVHVDLLNASFFGHYICYVKDLHGVWYKIDDCKVKRVELQEVLSQRGYMFLYSRLSFRPSPTADIQKSLSTMEKGDLHSSATTVNNEPNFKCSRTNGYLSSPFEAGEPLRSNLGIVQEAINGHGVWDSATSSDGFGSIQRPDSVLGSLNSCDADLLSVDLTSEDSGLVTSNSSCSEESSIKAAGKQGLNDVLSPLPEQNLCDTGLHRTTSCPLLSDAKFCDAASLSSIVGTMKHTGPGCHLNERSISADPLAGFTFLPQNKFDDGKLMSSVSKQSHDTPRTSDLTEDETSRISAVQSSCDLDVQGPEKMDCYDEVEQPSAQTSSDSFTALVKESAMDEIVDSSFQEIPTNCGLLVSSSYVSEPGLMENRKNVGHEHLLQAGPSLVQKLTNGFHPDISYTATLPSQGETIFFNKQQEMVPLVVCPINSTPATDKVVSRESVSRVDRFPNENGMANGIADSGLESQSHEYNHTMDHETCQTDKNTILDNPQAAMLEGSGTSAEFLENPRAGILEGSGSSPIPLSGAKVMVSFSNGGPISTPEKIAVKSKSVFAPGFLKRSPSSHPLTHSNPMQEHGKHLSLSGSCSSPKDSFNNNDDVGAKLMPSDSIHFDIDSRASLNVSSNENSSAPVDESKMASAVCSEIDLCTRGELGVSHTCEASGRERRSSVKAKPLFAPGFLNKGTKSQTVIQAKTSGTAQHGTNHCTPVRGQSGMHVVRPGDSEAKQEVNVGHDQSGSSSSNEKEIVGNGRKRALSSEPLYTEQEISVPLNVKGKSIITRQKQGRNDSCSCGSQQKWKKCCGRPDALRQTPGR